jgi:heat shock protein beta
MRPTQEQIYFFSGEDKRVLEKSPLVKGLVKKGYEVLLCDDPIDEYVFSTLKDYEGTVSIYIIQNIVNVSKGDFKLTDDGEFERKKHKWLTEYYKPYIEYAKKLLFEKVNSVVLSNPLTNEPCVVVADSYGQSSFMEKIHKSQLFAREGPNPQGGMK